MIRDRRSASPGSPPRAPGGAGSAGAGARTGTGPEPEGREEVLYPSAEGLRRLSPPAGADRLRVVGGEAPLLLLRIRPAGAGQPGWWAARRPEGPWRAFPAEPGQAGGPGSGEGGAVAEAVPVALRTGTRREGAFLLLRAGGRLELLRPPAWQEVAAFQLTGIGAAGGTLRLEAAALGDEVLFLLRPLSPAAVGSPAAAAGPPLLGALAADGRLRLPVRRLEGCEAARTSLAACGERAYLALGRPGEPITLRSRTAGAWPRAAWGEGAALPGSARLPAGRLHVVRGRSPGGREELLAVWRTGAGVVAWRFDPGAGGWELRPVDGLLAGRWCPVAPPLSGHAGWEGGWLPAQLVDPIQELPLVAPSGRD
ncbi:MAG: hypothetical protein QJR14_00720 [Bacillota bacterium]|nr:hypothetical protein [Bacillota bacterium]